MRSLREESRTRARRPKCNMLLRLAMSISVVGLNETSASRPDFQRPLAVSSSRTSLATLIRGGSQTPPPNPDPYSTTQQYSYAQQQQQQQRDNEDDDPFHETVQQRVDTWRTHQQEQSAAAQESPRDAQGRVKLLTSVSKGSRAIIFFCLMWRDIHLYELADQTHKGVKRLLCVVPLISLFVCNLAGVVSSLTAPSHSAKKRLKAILNLDKFLELVLIFFYFVRLTFLPSAYTPRELYIANTFHSIFFLIQCQAFTRLSWDEVAAPTVSSYSTARSYNDDFDDDSQQMMRRNNNYYYDKADRRPPEEDFDWQSGTPGQ